MYSVKMSLLGAPGTVRLTVRSGEEGAGADMAPDSLTLQLAAGGSNYVLWGAGKKAGGWLIVVHKHSKQCLRGGR